MITRSVPTFCPYVLKYTGMLPHISMFSRQYAWTICATNISQGDDNKLCNEYNDDNTQGDYPIDNIDDIQAFISL